ncbi:hypothetical protein M440DRAFT_239041 [Trichoderma longibrachiatum ATCC 18648]|uniref:Uncharacterized protein n=1 Tax=Trichoderma longibrachiatum ATCC 18648 TaxID=983965 RepID=A0A2T4CD34_TRILO|nr:hypothetical protein M440DRAFT_239041 [Trichoderma longibrachiatum ATCC 18648]
MMTALRSDNCRANISLWLDACTRTKVRALLAASGRLGFLFHGLNGSVCALLNPCHLAATIHRGTWRISPKNAKMRGEDGPCLGDYVNQKQGQACEVRSALKIQESNRLLPKIRCRYSLQGRFAKSSGQWSSRPDPRLLVEITDLELMTTTIDLLCLAIDDPCGVWSRLPFPSTPARHSGARFARICSLPIPSSRGRAFVSKIAGKHTNSFCRIPVPVRLHWLALSFYYPTDLN